MLFRIQPKALIKSREKSIFWHQSNRTRWNSEDQKQTHPYVLSKNTGKTPLVHFLKSLQKVPWTLYFWALANSYSVGFLSAPPVPSSGSIHPFCGALSWTAAEETAIHHDGDIPPLTRSELLHLQTPASLYESIRFKRKCNTYKSSTEF